MESDRVVPPTDEMHHALRDVFRTGRMLRQTVGGPVPAGLLGVLTAIDAMATQAGNRCHGKDLATRCALDPSTVSRSVSSLVALELVRRDADPVDGRASVLALTPRGRQALDEADRWHSAVVCEVLAEWSSDEVADLVALLRRFAADADRYARAALLAPTLRRIAGRYPTPTQSISDHALEAAQ
jgi:DNA-binding MarR family transcriptional regulator